jgi:hypothetical protein
MRDSLWHPPIIWIGLAHSEIEIMRGAGESSSDLSWLLFSIQGLRYRCWRRCYQTISLLGLDRVLRGVLNRRRLQGH